MGDVVKVKPGYARNYLLPLNKALAATEANKEHFANKRKQFEASNLENKKEADKIKEKLKEQKIALVRQAGEGGQLYGSVNARDVAIGLKALGFVIDRNQVSLDRPIKSVGLHMINISLHPEVDIQIIANVARSMEEAQIQEKTGQAIITKESDQKPLSENETPENSDFSNSALDQAPNEK